MHRSRVIIISGVAALAAVSPAAALAHSGDRNHDGLPDRWEARHHLSLRVNEATRDQDHDGLNNLGELRRGTDPRKADTDGDGLSDGLEVRTGNDPRRRDSDADGTADGRENAGSVTSFSGGVLTIRLGDGSTVSGTVNDATHMSCRRADTHEIEAETTVHHRRGTVAHAASNGTGSQGADDTPHAGEVENEHPTEVENEHGVENGDDSAGCAAGQLTPGAMVHEATLSSGVFADIELA
jgi:ribosomal protein L27